MEHPVVIAKDVKSFALEFWDGKPAGGKPADWLDEWDQTNRVPAMIKVTLQFKGDDTSQNSRENIKVIAPPAMAVPAIWQRAGGRPGAAPGVPGGQGAPRGEGRVAGRVRRRVCRARGGDLCRLQGANPVRSGNPSCNEN